MGKSRILRKPPTLCMFCRRIKLQTKAHVKPEQMRKNDFFFFQLSSLALMTPQSMSRQNWDKMSRWNIWTEAMQMQFKTERSDLRAPVPSTCPRPYYRGAQNQVGKTPTRKQQTQFPMPFGPDASPGMIFKISFSCTLLWVTAEAPSSFSSTLKLQGNHRFPHKELQKGKGAKERQQGKEEIVCLPLVLKKEKQKPGQALTFYKNLICPRIFTTTNTSNTNLLCHFRITYSQYSWLTIHCSQEQSSLIFFFFFSLSTLCLKNLSRTQN